MQKPDKNEAEAKLREILKKIPVDFDTHAYMQMRVDVLVDGGKRLSLQDIKAATEKINDDKAAKG